MMAEIRPALVLGAFAVLGGALFARLRRQKWSAFPAAILSALVILQPALTNSEGGLRAALFALAIVAVVHSALSLLERQNARRIVFLGGSLAGAQLVDPLCGAATTLVLPLVLQNSIGGGGAKTVGFWSSLVFVPILAGTVLVYFSLRAEGRVLHWPVPTFASSAPAWTPVCILLSAAPLAFTLYYGRRLRGASLLASVAACVVVVGSAVSGFAGRDELAMCEIAFAALLAIAISMWPRGEIAARHAILLGTVNSAWAWLLSPSVTG